METLGVFLASAVVAAVVSGVVTLIVPWSTWGVEKRKEAREHQRGLIKSWRLGLSEWDAEEQGGIHTRPAGFIKTAWYLTLRSYLTDAERSEFEAMDEGANLTVHIVSPAPPWHFFTPKAAEAIDRVEREWGLRS